jgi:glycosyltransferase involved in cell wall biosynthesis
MEQTSNVHLTIVRIATHPSLQPRSDYVGTMLELARELGLQQHVSWTDEVSWGSRQVMEQVVASDACILPHDYGVQLNHRGFAAAAVHGLPIIAIRGEIPESHLRHGEQLLFCPPASPQSLAEAALMVAQSPELRHRLSAGASELARTCYSWDVVAARMTELAFGEKAVSEPRRA